MITLRRQTYELQDNGDTLLTHLTLDSDTATFRFGDFFSAKKLNIEIERPWLGEIKADRFRLVRTKLGLFKSNFSRIMVKGQIAGDQTQRTLKLEIGVPGHVIFNFMWGSIALTTFIALATHDIFWTLLLATGILTFEILMIIVDINNTENKFADYIERVKATSHNNVFASSGVDA
jgi:hypothetical protein